MERICLHCRAGNVVEMSEVDSYPRIVCLACGRSPTASAIRNTAGADTSQIKFIAGTVEIPLQIHEQVSVPLRVEYSIDRYRETVISRIEIPYVLKSMAPDLRVDLLVEPFLREFNTRVSGLQKEFKYRDYLSEAVCYRDPQGEYHHPYMGQAAKMMYLCPVCEYIYSSGATKRHHLRNIHGVRI